MLASGTMAAAAAPLSRVDCQSHFFVPELLDLMEKRHESPRVYREGGDRYVVIDKWRRRILPKHTDVAAKLADMDAAGIGLATISINDPGPELFGADGLKVAHIVHDFIGGLAQQHSRRFAGLCTLPLQDMDASLRELERCVNKLNMRGILLYSNLGGRFPDEPPFRALFRRAEEMDVPILLHPAYPTTFDETNGYDMAAGLGLMFDTTIALARIILSGLLDQHPKLKLLCPHVGGALPYLIGRLDHQTMVLKRGAEHIRKPPSEYLRKVYFDTVSPIAMAIRYGYDFVGPERLLYASDHPWVDPKMIATQVQSLRLPSQHEEMIFAGNARKLFRL